MNSDNLVILRLLLICNLTVLKTIAPTTHFAANFDSLENRGTLVKKFIKADRKEGDGPIWIFKPS